MIEPSEYFTLVLPTTGFLASYQGAESVKALHFELDELARRYFVEGAVPPRILAEANGEDGLWQGLVHPHVTLVCNEKSVPVAFSMRLEVHARSELFDEPNWFRVSGWAIGAAKQLRRWWRMVVDEARYAGAPIKAPNLPPCLLLVNADDAGALDSLIYEMIEELDRPEEAYGWSEPLSTLARLPEGSGQGVSDLDRLKSRTAQILEWEHGLLTPQFGPDENGAEATYCCDTDFDLEAAEQLWRNGYPTEAFLQGDTEGDYRLISAPKGSKGRIAAIFSKEHKLEFSEVEGKIEAVLSLTFNRAWGDFAQRSLALRLAAEAGELLGTIGRSLALAAQGIQRTVVLQVRLEAVGVVAVAMKPKLESSLAEVSAIGKLIGANLKTGDVRLSQLQGYEKGAFAPLAHERLSTPVTLTERTINNIRDQMPGAVAVKVLDFNVNARRPHWIGIEEAIGRRTYLPFLVLTFFVAGQSPVPRYLIASVFGMVITDSVDGIGHEAAAVVRAMERQGAGLFFGRGPDLGPDKAFTELARFMVQIASDAPEQAPVVPFEAIAAVDISNPPTLKWFTELSTTEKLLARGWLMSQSPVGYSNYERVLAVPFSAPHFDLAVSAATLVLGPDDCSLESVIASALALSLLIALGAPGTAAAQDLLASYRARVEEELGVDLLGDMEERLVDALSGIQERSIQAIRQALKGLARQIISEPSPAPAG